MVQHPVSEETKKKIKDKVKQLWDRYNLHPPKKHYKGKGFKGRNINKGIPGN